MKKFSIKRIAALALSLVLFLSVCGFSAFSEGVTDITAGLSVLPKEEGYRCVGEEGNLKLYLNTATTNFYIEDSKTGKRTYAFPESFAEDDTTALAQQVEMQSAFVFVFWDPVKKTENRKNSNGLSVKQGNYTVYSKENGFLIKYELKTQKVTIALEVTLSDGKLLCSVPAGSITEGDTENHQLLRLSVLPYMIRGEANTEGEIILPDGSGEILDFTTVRAASAVYAKPIYGRNLSTALSVEDKTGYDVTCPYLALCKDDMGILAIPEKGAAVGYVNANPAGKSTNYANAYFSFDYRAADVAVIGDKQTKSSQSTRVFDDEVYSEDITVSYQFVYENATKSALAKLYGEYLAPGSLVGNGGGHSAIFDIYGFVNEKKSFLGFPYTAVSVLSSAEDMIALSNDEDLKNITLNLKNITGEQKKQTLNTSLDPVSKVLGKAELRTLNEGNASIYINANPITFRKGTLFANSFNSSSKTIYGAPVGLYEFRESTHMENKNIPKSLLLKHSKLLTAIEKLVKSEEKLGIDGMSSDQLGSVSYHDYSAPGTLADTHKAMEEAIALAAEKGGLILTAPNDYAIKYCSAILDIPTDSSHSDICSGSYPFLQIALGNKVSYATEPINLYRSPETMFLNALTTGSALHYSYILSDTKPVIGTELNFLYSADYSAFKEMTAKQYAAYNEIKEKTEGSGLSEYSSDGKTVTAVFENGAVVTALLTEKTYSVTK